MRQIITLVVIIISILLTSITNAQQVNLTFSWDKYNTTYVDLYNDNTAVTHFQIWQIDNSGNAIFKVRTGIAVADTTITFEWKADGKEYNFAMLAIANDVSSAFSNIASITVPDVANRKPLPISNMNVKIKWE